MAGITLTQAQTQLNKWLAASEAVSSRQSYSINGRSLTAVDASDILRQIQYWEGRVLQLSQPRGRRGRTRHMVPNS